MDLRVNVILFHDLVQAFQKSDETLDGQREYNTHAHTLEEIINALPQVNHIVPSPTQPFLPLQPWLGLIMSSQGLSDTDVHQIELPKPFVSQALVASQIALIRGYVSDCNAEDLADLFPRRTTRGINIEQLLQEEKYFVGLDTCSLKDAIIGRSPVRNSKDLWTRLATSAREVTGMRAMRNSLPEQPVLLFPIKWNDRMQTDLEYRVFCAPAGGEIAAILPYKWHVPWYHAKEDSSQQKIIAKRVLEGAKAIHARIKAHPAMAETFKERGYVFDIVEDPEVEIRWA
ncbi:MAG: hypothetical protein Q9213_002813 [Squamulea squamosa]